MRACVCMVDLAAQLCFLVICDDLLFARPGMNILGSVVLFSRNTWHLTF